MSLPKYTDFYQPILKSLEDGQLHVKKEIQAFCVTEMGISEEEQRETFENGNLVLPNRIGWALTYLKKAELIFSPSRSQYVLSDEGKRVVKEEIQNVDSEFLKKYPCFLTFLGQEEHEVQHAKEDLSKNDTESPEEILEKMILKINSALEDELMSEVMKMSPYEFERLVMKVLLGMGYRGTEGNVVTKKSNDEGIDGIVSQDDFGFEKIYVQAKQWKKDNNVGRQEIQKFLGALAGQGGNKGLFITTSDFSQGAKEYVQKQLNHKIVLINGKRLLQLMIKYEIGVSVAEVYKVKRIDSDFFGNGI